MVQQTIDSKFSDYGLPKTETGLPNHDKQHPLSVTTKKTALRDLQYENRVAVPKSVGSSLFPKESVSKLEAVKISGMKRPIPESLVNPPHHQSLTSTATNGHLVYVRRRPEVELAKSSSLDNMSNNAYLPQARKLAQQDETTEQKSQIKEPKLCAPEVAPIPRTSSVCFSSVKPSLPSSLGKSSNILLPADTNYLSVSSTAPPLDYPKRTHKLHWEERYCELQDLLKMFDQSNQEDYVQLLRSLSSVDLSKHAFELEKRSIHLSLEEAKEMQRVQVLDVLGKYPKNSRAPSSAAHRAQPDK
ncbi:uncharacterized protein LOC127802640 [Diospyros lotus]|uniref:uncharacterized protein LOC127802640 n=1 Tax=Diospyros lotus TaxID=55363 RepID=UPI002259EAA0|nr:uncharacterized protein LOC127802640 [Diospyros lotus]XP_052194534.1 uncharacterized protein LOC127802640 [Diospyros lotus]